MFAYVGSRTTRERNARGDGITVFRVDQVTGRLTELQVLEGLINPSFLALNSTCDYLYCVHGDREQASAFRVGSDGTLSYLNTQSTQGLNPVHLAVDPTGRFLVVSNHYGGSLAVLPILENGLLGEWVERVQVEGPIGPHRVEQTGAKPHFNPFDPSGQFVIVPDKGLDRIFSFRFDSAQGRLLPAACVHVVTREGAGPRHVAFHPLMPWVYAVNELDSTVTSYRFNSATGELVPFQIVSALPDSFTGNSRGAEIEVDRNGRFVYSSNRGCDSIAVFQVDPDCGRLTLIGVEPSQGMTPRFFALSPDGAFLYAANENSDSVVTFRVDPASGRLSATGDVVTVGSPVCIVFADKPEGEER